MTWSCLAASAIASRAKVAAVARVQPPTAAADSISVHQAEAAAMRITSRRRPLIRSRSRTKTSRSSNREQLKMVNMKLQFFLLTLALTQPAFCQVRLELAAHPDGKTDAKPT